MQLSMGKAKLSRDPALFLYQTDYAHTDRQTDRQTDGRTPLRLTLRGRINAYGYVIKSIIFTVRKLFITFEQLPSASSGCRSVPTKCKGLVYQLPLLSTLGAYLGCKKWGREHGNGERHPTRGCGERRELS